MEIQPGHLRQTRRPGGLDHQGRFLGSPQPQFSLKKIGSVMIECFAPDEQLPEGDEPGIVPIGPHAGRIDVDHSPDMVEPVADGNHLIDLLLILGKYEGGADSFDGCGQLFGYGRREEVQRDPADGL
jgi:hypothetical protein